MKKEAYMYALPYEDYEELNKTFARFDFLVQNLKPKRRTLNPEK